MFSLHLMMQNISFLMSVDFTDIKKLMFCIQCKAKNLHFNPFFFFLDFPGSLEQFETATLKCESQMERVKERREKVQ